MEEHPIQGLMKTAMENIKEMVDVNTIIGDPVETPDGSVIIPISRVSFGFAAGGSEFEHVEEEKGSKGKGELPFGGGSGGGVSVQPVAFLVMGSNGQVRMLPVDRHAMLDRLIDMAPQLVNQLQNLIKRDNGQDNQMNYEI
ncbi:MAG: GerW family sporulation protein [Clostridiales bacterium]|jgi:sporulation protein YtfJ|nr:GerW family sporulation protein [Clostridiales bacterium]